MMFIHGGYWRALDKKDFSFLAPAWVDAGVSLAVVNYDLCPRVTHGGNRAPDAAREPLAVAATPRNTAWTRTGSTSPAIPPAGT